MKHEPSSDLLQFLRSKNILPNGYFSLEEPDGTYTFYSVSRSGVLYTLDLEPAALSADDVWEKLDRIQKISREVFEQAQESLWDTFGGWRAACPPAGAEAGWNSFTRTTHSIMRKARWKTAARYDEETIQHSEYRLFESARGGKISRPLGTECSGPCPGKGVFQTTRYFKK